MNTREEFEKWTFEHCNCQAEISLHPDKTPWQLRSSPNDTDSYTAQDSHYRWQAWQACAELKNAEIAKLREELDALNSQNRWQW